jgi:hypothetical protein
LAFLASSPAYKWWCPLSHQELSSRLKLTTPVPPCTMSRNLRKSKQYKSIDAQIQPDPRGVPSQDTQGNRFGGVTTNPANDQHSIARTTGDENLQHMRQQRSRSPPLRSQQTHHLVDPSVTGLHIATTLQLQRIREQDLLIASHTRYIYPSLCAINRQQLISDGNQ